MEEIGARADTDADVVATLPDRIVGSLAELVGLDYDPNEEAGSITMDDSDPLDAFPLSTGELPADFPWSGAGAPDFGDDIDDDFDVNTFLPRP
jgi:hypothetical protein